MSINTNVTKVLVDERKWSKYKVAKKCGVSWASVQLWYKDVFTPSKTNQDKLDSLVAENE